MTATVRPRREAYSCAARFGQVKSRAQRCVIPPFRSKGSRRIMTVPSRRTGPRFRAPLGEPPLWTEHEGGNHRHAGSRTGTDSVPNGAVRKWPPDANGGAALPSGWGHHAPFGNVRRPRRCAEPCSPSPRSSGSSWSRSSTNPRARNDRACSPRSPSRSAATTCGPHGSWAGSRSTSCCCSTSTGSSAAIDDALSFARELAQPLVVTLHTVLSEPSPHQPHVLASFAGRPSSSSS